MRERRLAGDTRAGTSPRARAAHAQRAYAIRHWRFLSAAIASMLAVTMIPLLFVPHGFVQGLVAGIVITQIAWLAIFWIVSATGTAPTMMGDLGEQWTASELRKLRRRGWRTINHFSLRKGDIDHVLVGPGGVYAVETKWSASPWTLDPADSRILQAARQAASNAKALQLWSNLKRVVPTQVHPVVVLWGTDLGSQGNLVAAREIAGVTVVIGPRFGEWARALPAEGLTPEQVGELWQVFDKQVGIRDASADASARPIVAVSSLVAHAALVLVAGVCGLLATFSLIGAVRAMAWWPVAMAALALLGLFARRYRRLRYVALAWTTGVLASAVVIGLALLVDQG